MDLHLGGGHRDRCGGRDNLLGMISGEAGKDDHDPNRPTGAHFAVTLAAHPLDVGIGVKRYNG
jgi:hypothetical protein